MVKKTKIGIYLLPNVLTTFGLFSGFFAIILAINGDYATAAFFIFIAMLWDGIDGRVARLTNTQSDFGVQYDSMADMLSFGVAPALLVYFWEFRSLGKIGWIVTFVYIAATILRLVRFNIQSNVEDKLYFQGLPSPAAAALLAGMVWAKERLGIIEYDQYLYIVALCVVLSASALMVSNIRYYSFKETNFKGRVSFKLLLIATLIIVIITLLPSFVLFFFFLIYALSGVIITTIKIRKKRKAKKKHIYKDNRR